MKEECKHIYGAYIPVESESGGLCEKGDVLWCAKSNCYDHFKFCPECGKELQTVEELRQELKRD